MGTITIGIWAEKLETDIAYDLEQYLKETNPKLTLNEREENKLNRSNFYLDRSGFTKHTFGYINDRFVMVLSKPKPFINRMYDYKITWHQSQWLNQREVVETFTNIFGLRNTKTILCDSQVLRSDFWLECEIDYNLFKRSTYRPGVSSLDQRKSEKLSCYFGTKKPKQAVTYQRPYDLNKRMDISKKKTPFMSQYYTRVEIRYFNKQVPIKYYAEYANTGKMDVFRIIKTVFVYKNRFIESARKSKLDPKKVASFLELTEREGLHHARAVLNQNRNFYRTLEPILLRNGVVLNLSQAWKKKLQDQVIGDFDIEDFFRINGGAYV